MNRGNIERMSKRKLLIAVILVIALSAAVAIFIRTRSNKTLTSYKDENFLVYECTKPIKAKEGTVPSMFGGRMYALIPADQNEAKKYCKPTGIE